ncbi:MAG TPA: hypothetical protein VIG90_04220 [Pedomonas sp.]|uniref:hypothetical protein n=1 Tax=Pedomonas sp. TaxID=2976421 RepID=UPI002F41F2D0
MMAPSAFDFRIDAASVDAAQASISALGRALSAVTLTADLSAQLQALAPRGEATSGVARVMSEACQHGAVTIVQARLAPGDAYLTFIAALAARAGLSTRFSHGWPILLQNPLAARAAASAPSP